MLEQSLLLQFIFLTGAAIVFVGLMALWGTVTMIAVSVLLRTRKAISPFLFPFIGIVTYTSVLLLIGTLHLLTKSTVLFISVTPLILLCWPAFTKRLLQAVYGIDFSLLGGQALFFVASIPFWFRPATTFDAMWYHLTIPKLFLQDHSTTFLGVSLLRYSLQPTLSFFTGLFPLSLPVSTAHASIIINAISTLLLVVSFGYAVRVGTDIWAWTKTMRAITPFLLGASFMLVGQLGYGGNDIMATSFTLVAGLFIFSQLRRPKIDLTSFVAAILILIGLATFKLFDTTIAIVLFAYLLIDGYRRIEPGRRLMRVFIILLTLFCIYYLPWIIRSYIYSGRLLDPIGAPGIDQMYRMEGGGTPIHHWTVFIFKRFYESLLPILLFMFTPLVFLSTAVLWIKKLKSEVTTLWVVAWTALLLSFTASIALQWRYYLPETTLLAFIGIAVLFELLRNKGLSAFVKIVCVLFCVLIGITTGFRALNVATDGHQDASMQGKLYIQDFTSTSGYLDKKIVGRNYSYRQAYAPADLTADEPVLVYGIHNIGYMNNPAILSQTPNNHLQGLQNTPALHSQLKILGVRYVLVKGPVSNLCKQVGIRRSERAACVQSFTKVFSDTSWDVSWYVSAT